MNFKSTTIVVILRREKEKNPKILLVKGIDADLYTLPRDVYGGTNKDNECYNEDNYRAEDGLQNISPCQYGKLLLKQS